MANISVIHNNILAGGSQVTATGVATGANVGYLSDNRLSFKFVSQGSDVQIQINQPNENVRGWQYVGLLDHSGLVGGNIQIDAWASIERIGFPLNTLDETITSDNPLVFDKGDDSAFQFIDVNITGPSPGASWSIGELVLGPRFDSPQRPGIGINTTYMPRSTFVTLPNGERQTIKHAEVVRQKEYTIPGLSYENAQLWADVFISNEGSQLVIFTDEKGDIYPALMDTSLRLNDQVKLVSLELRFEEVKV